MLGKRLPADALLDEPLLLSALVVQSRTLNSSKRHRTPLRTQRTDIERDRRNVKK